MYRNTEAASEVFLVHPGGPFWVRKDLGAWTIPKGECMPEEEPLAAAQREFHEETSFNSAPPYHPLGEVKQPGGKLIAAWAFAGDCDPVNLVSNTCLIAWPPRSNRMLTIPEIDRGAWFTPEEAQTRILKGQAIFLERLAQYLREPRR